MKNTNKIIALLLSIIIMASTYIPAYASNGKFISITVTQTDNNGGKINTNETVYTDGQYLYTSLGFLSKYTLYTYDSNNSAFVREGQAFKAALSKAQLDFTSKTVTVSMMSSKKSYKLHNLYKIGNDYYLPLDQMAGFLKASLKFDNKNNLCIKSSGFSIADAAYLFNNYKYIFDYDDITNRIFYGDESLYKTYCVYGYFYSTIFGLKIKNLDIIGKSQNTDSYKNILESCVTDNSEYLKSQSSDDSFTKRMKSATDFSTSMKTAIDKAKDCTTVAKDAYELFNDTNDISNLDMDYINVKNWNGVFSKLSKSLSYVQYMSKAVAMTDDNKAMLNDYYNYVNSKNEERPLINAVTTTHLKFGVDLFTGIGTKVAESLISDLPKEAVEKYASKAVPYLAVIKGVNAFVKLFGVDLSDNSQYNVMLENDIESDLSQRYDELITNAGSTKTSSEEFRRAAIFLLASCKHGYESGNKLDKKLKGTGKQFDREIDNVCARLNLFYLAAESKNYDNIDGINKIIKDNQTSISNSGIISKAKDVTEPTKSNNSQDILLKDTKVWKKIKDSKWLDYNERIDTFGEIEIDYSFSSGGKMVAIQTDEMGKHTIKSKLISYNNSTITYKLASTFESAPNGTIKFSLVKNSKFVAYTIKRTNGKSYSGLMSNTKTSSSKTNKKNIDYVLKNHWNGAKYIGSKSGKTAGVVSFNKQTDSKTYSISGTIAVDGLSLDYSGYYDVNEAYFQISDLDNTIVIEYVNKNTVNAFIFEYGKSMVQETWTKV